MLITDVPVSTRASDWGIYCTGAGCDSFGLGRGYARTAGVSDGRTLGVRRRVLNAYQLVYITRGRGRFRCAPDYSVSVGGGDVFLLFPGVWHGYRPRPGIGWDEYWVGFDGPYARLLQLRSFISSAKPVYRVGLRQDLLDGFLTVLREAERQASGFQFRLGAMIMQIVAMVIGAAAAQREVSESESIIEHAKFYMTENIDCELNLSDLLGELSVSYSTLLKLFRNYADLSPYQYFLNLKIERAKTLLLDPEASVKQVAYDLGFQNPYYFSRLFHRKAGHSPSEWRSRAENAKELR